jgi:hypothetical protein
VVSNLSQLISRKATLETEVQPLQERLQRCEQAEARLDEAQRLRDAALDRYDATTADNQIYGRASDIDPGPLNLAEIHLRQAQGEARAALKAKQEIIDQQAALNAQLSAIGVEIEEEIWTTADAATALEFEAAEAAQRQVAEKWARLDSIAQHAYRQAHQGNGRDPHQHPAMRFFHRHKARVEVLTASLGLATRDFKTGPALFASIEAGTAQLGDISRWTPPSRALPESSLHINRGTPETATAPVDANPAESTSEPEATNTAKFSIAPLAGKWDADLYAKP